MERYLDPKNDLLFKKIFGQHKDLLISFLNAFLPLKTGQEIREIEYLSSEQVPETPYGKLSIVDVKCIDNHERSFIVEMQNEWTKAFSNRLLVNGAKSIVNQMDKKHLDDLALDFCELEPVYVLAVVNDEFTKKSEKEWYHHLKLTNPQNPDLVLTGLDYVLLELPKFKPETWKFTDKKMAVLWLRFLRELNHNTEKLSEELKSNRLIRKAINICRESALTPQEKRIYDDYLMNIMWNNTYKNMEKKFAESEKRVAESEKKIVENEKKIVENEKIITEKDKTITENEKIIAEKDKELAKLKAELAKYTND